jgi:hypothetical protein
MNMVKVKANEKSAANDESRHVKNTGVIWDRIKEEFEVFSINWGRILI